MQALLIFAVLVILLVVTIKRNNRD